MRWLILLCLVWGATEAAAQELVFAKDHSHTGAPVARGEEFSLDQFGEELDLIFRQKDPIVSSKLYFFIDRKVGDSFLGYDTKSIAPTEESNWLALRYRFERSGLFRVVVLNEEKDELCRAQVRINVFRDFGGPDYYQDAELVFCHQIGDGGEPDMHLDRVPLGRHRNLKVLLKHFHPLRTQYLTVDVWKRNADKLELVESARFSVQGYWNYAQFPYQFKEPGQYLLRVYSDDEVHICSGEIEVFP